MPDLDLYLHYVKLGLAAGHLIHTPFQRYSCSQTVNCDHCICLNKASSICHFTELINSSNFAGRMNEFERTHVTPILLKSNPELFL